MNFHTAKRKSYTAKSFFQSENQNFIRENDFAKREKRKATLQKVFFIQQSSETNGKIILPYSKNFFLYGKEIITNCKNIANCEMNKIAKLNPQFKIRNPKFYKLLNLY